MRAVIVLSLFATPSVALANMGLPMLTVVWPLSVLAIAPVIAIESWVVSRALNVGWRTVTTQMVKANIVSTLIGIPLAWVASVAIEFLLAFLVVSGTGSNSYPPHAVGKVGAVILSAPWLGPFESGGHWILPVATIVLLIPFFFASFWVEAWYVARALSPNAPEKARRAIWNANLASYTLLFGACVIWLGYGLITHVTT